MVNVVNMEKYDGDCDKSCVNYLRKLLNSNENVKFDFHYFQTILQNVQVLDEVILHFVLTSIFELLKRCDKNFQMCSDLAHGFCVTVSSVPDGVAALFDIIQKTEISSHFHLIHSADLNDLIRKNYNVLVLGILKLFSTCEAELETNRFEILNSKIVDLIGDELLDQCNVNTLLCVAETWLSIVVRTETQEGTLKRVYASILSIVTIFWNIDISEFRNRVENIFLKCFCLNYEKDKERKPYTSTLNIVVNMTIFRAVAYDMVWSLPFKYYAYAVALKFVVRNYHLLKFLKYVRDDLRVGFAASLRNKRVISAETELFKFCTNSLPFAEWWKIFHPIIETVLSSSNLIVANNFSRYWLPTVIRNFPQYAAEIFDRIPQQTNGRTVVQSRVLFALFKACHLRRVKLVPAENVDEFAIYVRTFFFDAEDTLGELFALLCGLREQSTLHSAEELRTILIFLRNNARSGSTILRQHLFSSFARFVLRLICSSVRTVKSDEENGDRNLVHVLRFLVELNEFFACGLEPGCCYQRKLVSLTLYKIFMTYSLRDCGGEIRRNNLKEVEKFVTFARSRGCWNFDSRRNCVLLCRCLMDSCEEIQSLSFVLLRTFFDANALESYSSSPTSLFSDVSQLLTDTLFFKRNSGVSAVLSLICLAYNAGNESAVALLKTVDHRASNFTDVFLNLLETQVVVLQKDILNSAVHHPLDATIKILIFLMTHESSPESRIISDRQIERLISLLEIVVPILLKALFIDKFSDYAPSFEESDNALEAIISNSSIINELNVRDSEEDEFQLKPVNQILLNFIWISLKVCSELESYLISSRFRSLSEEQLIRCSDLVIQKLKLCRHKGVIEAAGISLSNIVKILTENNACEKWLQSIISEIIYLIEHKSGATVSRKSGGLSLLIQNIVGNDKRTNKPLLSLCWAEFRRILDVDFSRMNQTILEELPQAHVLHFLKVLIADARNSEELSIYFEEISLVCLKTLKAPIWTIRNAALQLFGAIVPKMVGQKNSLNDFGVRRSFEEVFLRMPALLTHIVDTFEVATAPCSRRLIRDSDLVPLLIILANVQVASVHSMEANLFSRLLQLRRCTKHLLSSPLHFVRELASKSYVSLFCESELSIFRAIVDDVVGYVNTAADGGRRVSGILNENHLHGHLLVLKYAFFSYSASSQFHKLVGSPSRRLLPFHVKVLHHIPPISAALLYDLEIVSCAGIDAFSILNVMTGILDTLPDRKYLLIGYEAWSRTLIQKIFENGDENSIGRMASFCARSQHSCVRNNFLKILSTSSKYRSACADAVFDLFGRYVNNEKDKIDGRALNELFNVLVRLPASTWDAAINKIHFSEALLILIRMDHYEYQAANLRVLCLLATTTAASSSHVAEIFDKIRELLNPTKSNKDVRRNAASSVLTLLQTLAIRSLLDARLLWLTVVEIVQDEELEIRAIGCECYQHMRNAPACRVNPEIVLNELFDANALRTIFPAEVIAQILWRALATSRFDIVVDCNDEIVSPFDQGVLNVYKEDARIVSLAGRALVEVVHTNSWGSDSSSGELKSEITRYYRAFLRQLLQSVEQILKNSWTVSCANYTLVVRCYFLLSVFEALQEESSFSIALADSNFVDVYTEDHGEASERASGSQTDEVRKMKLMSWINKYMKIEMTDGRILIGTFVCTDKDANVILSACSELFNTAKTGISEEPRMLGLVMIPGRHIVSIHLEKTCPVHDMTTIV